MRAEGILIRKGQLTLISAGSGTGKSAFTQAIVQRGNDEGDVNRTFYFSADSDSSVMFKRAASIASGYTMTDVEHRLNTTDGKGLDDQVNAATKHIWWDFTSSPTQEHVTESLEAYALVMGDYPEVIVMDNIKNLWSDDLDEFRGLEDSAVFLSGVARDTGAAVIALHHVLGEFDNGISPIPMSGVRGKISKTPEVILTLHRSELTLNVSPVKNRNGKADPSGRWFLPIKADLSTMNFEG